MKVKIKSGIKYILAEQSVFARLVNSYLETLNRDRIFGTDIYIALCSADSVTGNSHSLDNGMRVALKHRTVHKRARVTLVGVADNVFLRSLIRRAERPFASCRESAAASSAKP